MNGSEIHVTSDTEHEDPAPSPTHAHHPIEQTDKPRAGIAAEYLAKGYRLSDHVLQREPPDSSPFSSPFPVSGIYMKWFCALLGAIDIDKKQGISHKFLSYIQQFDQKVGQRALGPEQTISGKVTATVKDLDEKNKLTQTANDVSTSTRFQVPDVTDYSVVVKVLFQGD